MTVRAVLYWLWLDCSATSFSSGWSFSPSLKPCSRSSLVNVPCWNGIKATSPPSLPSSFGQQVGNLSGSGDVVRGEHGHVLRLGLRARVHVDHGHAVVLGVLCDIVEHLGVGRRVDQAVDALGDEVREQVHLSASSVSVVTPSHEMSTCPSASSAAHWAPMRTCSPEVEADGFRDRCHSTGPCLPPPSPWAPPPPPDSRTSAQADAASARTADRRIATICLLMSLSFTRSRRRGVCGGTGPSRRPAI